MSLIPVAICRQRLWHQWQICRRYCWHHRYQGYQTVWYLRIGYNRDAQLVKLSWCTGRTQVNTIIAKWRRGCLPTCRHKISGFSSLLIGLENTLFIVIAFLLCAFTWADVVRNFWELFSIIHQNIATQRHCQRKYCRFASETKFLWEKLKTFQKKYLSFLIKIFWSKTSEVSVKNFQAPREASSPPKRTSSSF